LRLGTLVLLVSLASTVPLGLFAAWLHVSLWQSQGAVIDRQNIEMARAISVSVDKEVESTIAALRVLASLGELHAGSDPDGLRHYEEIALRLVARQRRWRAVLLIDPEGRVLSSTAIEGGPPGSFGESPWFERIVATMRATPSDLLADPATGRHFVTVGVPVRRDGELLYVVAAEIGSEALSEILRRYTPVADGVATLIDSNRVIMARTRGEAKFVGGLPSPRFQEAARSMSEGSWDDVLLEGTPVYAALSTSELTGWTVGVGVGTEAVDAPIRRSAAALAAVGLGILLIGVVVSVRVGQGIGSTLGGVSAAAQALARGGTVDPPMSSVVELDELSSAVREAAVILDNRLKERDRAEREREEALRRERAARRATEQNEARLSVMVSSIGDAVVATDAEGRVTLVNPVAEALTGWRASEAVGRRIDEVVALIDEASRSRIEIAVRSVTEGQLPVRGCQVLLVGRDGREVPVEDSVAPIRSAEGEMHGLVLVFRDVTEARRTEQGRLALLEQEQHARRAAEAVSRDKDEFVATVSHELRNPLNAILGWIQLLRSGALDEDTRVHALEVVDRNARTQARLIEDLLDTSRVARGQLRLDLRPVDVTKVVEAAMVAVEPTARTRDLELGCHFDARGAALADSDRLQQVFWNLLTNAIKFTPRGGRIRLEGGIEGDDVVVRVIDDGIGIGPELLPRIFERFTQGRDDGGAKAGLGIGLALVRHLVELHGGTVTAESAGEGAGATFTVRLPVLDDLAAAGGVGTPDGARGAGTALDGLRVLVVEDDADSRDLVATALRRAGATVTPAASAREALEQLDATDPQLVFSDIGMPGMTGYQLLERLRAHPRHHAVPVVAVTAYGRSQDRERALAEGFDHHLGKPVDPAALVRIAAAIAQR
jgi:PAS domain S-box-containing protein